MKRVNIKFLVAIMAAAAVVGGGVYCRAAMSSKPVVAGASTIQARPTRTDNIHYKGQDGRSALALLKQKAAVQTKQSQYGEYVVSINANDGGGKKYWLFYVNGQEATVGAGAYITKSSDAIEWRLQ
jgi:hypothetical protein